MKKCISILLACCAIAGETAAMEGSLSQRITLKTPGNRLVVFKPQISEEGLPELSSYKTMFAAVSEGIRQGTIVSAYVGEEGGALAALFKMSFGNRLGFAIEGGQELLQLQPGLIVA